MWEVMNEEEWNTIYQILRDKNRNIIWVNGKSTDECDDPQKVHFQLSPDFVPQTQITSDRPVVCAAGNNCQLVNFSAKERRELATACP